MRRIPSGCHTLAVSRDNPACVKSDDPEKDTEWADIVVFDDTLGQGEKAQELRARGKRVVGGSPYTDRLEDDRSFGQEELKKAGVNIIPYKEFDSFDDAVEHVTPKIRLAM